MRRHQLALLLSHLLIACASTPEPRPAALDPSNPEAPRAPSIAPLEAFTTGPQGLHEPLLPPPKDHAQPGEESPAQGHEGHESPSPEGEAPMQQGNEGHGSPGTGANVPAPEGHEQHGGEAAPEPEPPAAAPGGHEGHEGHAP